MVRRLTFASLCMLALGCNQVELFRVAGHVQEDFSNDADVLFVIDNSSSMLDESEGLALNFDTFIRQFTDDESGVGGTDGLADAVDNYIASVRDKASFVDYQLAITTTDVETTYGALYGATPILDNNTPDVATEFTANLLCDSTCIVDATELGSDTNYDCVNPPTPPGDELTVQYMNCLCGSGTWEDQCGVGTEEHLEAIFMAMCRAVDDPPDACFEENQFTDADIGSNAGLLREGSTFIPIIITDEGDTSRRMSQGDGLPNEYSALFDQFHHRMNFAVVGPTTDNCNSGGATTWGVQRLQWFVDDTGGRYSPIAEGSGDNCHIADFAATLEQLGKLLNSLLDSFVLQQVPDVDSISVIVDGHVVKRSTETIDDSGFVTYGDGWSYDAGDNAIRFHGSAVPDYEVPVRIYYLPIAGMPRELPF